LTELKPGKTVKTSGLFIVSFTK